MSKLREKSGITDVSRLIRVLVAILDISNCSRISVGYAYIEVQRMYNPMRKIYISRSMFNLCFCLTVGAYLGRVRIQNILTTNRIAYMKIPKVMSNLTLAC